jgi:diguanylate cyclase (GGDEF)-like protein/PAS domain S-box-containing protein
VSVPGAIEDKETIVSPGRAEAKAASALLVAGAGFVVLSLVLPHPAGADEVALGLTAAAMAAAGALGWLFGDRTPLLLVHVILAAAAALTGLLIYLSGVAVGQYGSIFVWATLIAAYFFPRRVAAFHLGWLLAVNAATLALVENTAGYSPLTRWFFTAVSLTVVMLLTTALVARRARADERARRFFDLSHDMLCTANMEGYFVELNDAWTSYLGYTKEELRSLPFVERVHPEDRDRTEEESAQLFAGAGSATFENRYLAKDGTWHWLRWSSQLAMDEGLIYARATDITELKRVEAEREELLEQVQDLARRDPLTGLPNRRTLQEQLPREMSRARRARSPLCAAILDIDHFKAYNDHHGHLAGDQVLRECAVAWDCELRGEDTIVRFGGEEFLVLLPDTEIEQAAEIVERLRAATPLGQTCSAGIACWDYAESGESLLDRADVALYMAKAGGRDRVVEAPPPAPPQS